MFPYIGIYVALVTRSGSCFPCLFSMFVGAVTVKSAMQVSGDGGCLIERVLHEGGGKR